MKTGTKEIVISISPEVAKKLDEGSYNKNKLVNRLLQEYLDKKEK